MEIKNSMILYKKEVSISKYNTLWPVIIRLSNFQLSVSTNFCDFILVRRNLILAKICHLKGILNRVHAYNLFISCVSIVVHAYMYIIYLGNWHIVVKGVQVASNRSL